MEHAGSATETTKRERASSSLFGCGVCPAWADTGLPPNAPAKCLFFSGAVESVSILSGVSTGFFFGWSADERKCKRDGKESEE
jgi:hypothetical protein